MKRSDSITPASSRMGFVSKSMPHNMCRNLNSWSSVRKANVMVNKRRTGSVKVIAALTKGKQSLTIGENDDKHRNSIYVLQAQTNVTIEPRFHWRHKTRKVASICDARYFLLKSNNLPNVELTCCGRHQTIR